MLLNEEESVLDLSSTSPSFSTSTSTSTPSLLLLLLVPLLLLLVPLLLRPCYECLKSLCLCLKRPAAERALPHGRKLSTPAHWPGIGITPTFLFSNTSLLETIKTLAKQCNNDIVEIFTFGSRVVVISDVDCAKEMLNARPKFFRRLGLYDYAVNKLRLREGLLFSNGNTWVKSRKFMAPSFNKQNVNSQMALVWKIAQQWARELVSTKGDGKTVLEFRRNTFVFGLRAIAKVAFGIDETHTASYFNGESFIDDFENILLFISTFAAARLPSFLWQFSKHYQTEVNALEAMRRIDAASAKVIEDRRQELLNSTSTLNNTTVLDVLLNKVQGEQISDSLLLSNVKLLFLVGSETTGSSIAFAVSLLFQDQYKHCLERVRKEAAVFCEKFENLAPSADDVILYLPYTEAVFKEVLRIQSPTPIIFMSVDQDYATSGMTFPCGITVGRKDFVMIHVDGILLNERFYDDALSFKPERWVDSDPLTKAKCEENFLTFGYGSRSCPGARLAICEGAMVLAALTHIIDIKLTCDPAEIKKVQFFTAIPSKVPVTLSPRQHN